MVNEQHLICRNLCFVEFSKILSGHEKKYDACSWLVTETYIMTAQDMQF